jgi:hypothetical protein
LGDDGEASYPLNTSASNSGFFDRFVSLICWSAAVVGCTQRFAADKRELATQGPSQPAGRTSDSTSIAVWAETNEFTLPIPAGYRNATEEFAGAGFAIVLAQNKVTEPYSATIVVRRVPIPGGSFDQPAECRQTALGLVQGGTEAPGTGGTLKSAEIIDGPVGKTCQIHLIAPQGVALITELHRPGNSRSTPKDIWLMTCNHGEGNALAESACRFALSGFRFRAQ